MHSMIKQNHRLQNLESTLNLEFVLIERNMSGHTIGEPYKSNKIVIETTNIKKNYQYNVMQEIKVSLCSSVIILYWNLFNVPMTNIPNK